MALRIRTTGEILCAAKHPRRAGDTYIPDGLHYELSVIQRVLIPNADEAETGKWHWREQCPESCERMPALAGCEKKQIDALAATGPLFGGQHEPV